MRKELLIMISSQFVSTLSCWSGVPRSMLDNNKEDMWHGWPPPDAYEPAKEEWIKDWKQQYKPGKSSYLTDEELKNGVKPEGHDITDWPEDWQNLGPGYGGMVPPPWAWRPEENRGSPVKCYFKPARGDCHDIIKRWGYNPATFSCEQFEYSGCGGNANNFYSAERCERDCLQPAMGCDPHSNIPIPLMKMEPALENK